MPQKKKLGALQYLDGDTKKSGILRDIGLEALDVPVIPKHLNDDARQCIIDIQSGMPPGLYAKADSYVLACFGMAWAVHKRAVEEINRPGFDFIEINSKGNANQSPWLKILNTQALVIVKLADRLGLDPRSRQELQQPARPSQSKFQGLIGPALIEHNE